MGVETDRERLGREICPCLKSVPGDHAPHLSQQCAWADDLANAVVESKWLAARDAELIAATRKQVLGEAVEALEGFDCLTDPVPSHVDVPDDYEAGMHDAARIVANLRDGGESK